MSGHKTDTNYERYRRNTSLSKHIWNLKEENIDYNIEWSLVEKGADFNPTSKKCGIYTLVSQPMEEHRLSD